MRNKKFFYIGFIITVASLSSLVNINSFRAFIETHCEETQNKQIYIDFSLVTGDYDDLHPTFYFFNNEEQYELQLEYVDNYIFRTSGDHSYQYVICCDSFIIGLFNNNYFTGKILSQQLKDLSFNYICVDSIKNNNALDVKGFGFFNKKISNPGASYQTQRIWLKNENTFFYANDPWGGTFVNSVCYYNENEIVVVEMEKVISSFDGSFYYYADIPFWIDTFYFLRMSNTIDHPFLVDRFVLIKQTAYGLCYFTGVSSLDDYLKVDAGIVFGADAVLLSFVVDAYLIYGDYPSNGCKDETIFKLFHTWFNNKSATKNDLKNIEILDYSGFTANGNSYYGLEKDQPYSVNEKWNTMCSQARINPETGQRKNDIFAWFQAKGIYVFFVIIGFSFLIVIFIAVYFLKKRKG